MKFMILALSSIVMSTALGQTIHQFDLHLATSIVDVGDVDHDGAADFAVAFHNNSLVRVYSGATATVLHQFGADAGGAPPPIDSADMNNDGEIDLVVGAWTTGNSDEGAVFVVDHATGGVLTTFAGGAPTFRLGRSVSIAGDADNDGFVDVVAGASDRAFLYSGQTSMLLHQWHEPIGDFGFDVGGGRDIDNDGHDDVIIGNPGFGSGGSLSNGRAIVFKGANGAALITLDGTGFVERLGEGVGLAPDLNGDGKDDVLVYSKDKSIGQLPGGALQALAGPFGIPKLWEVSAQKVISPRSFDVNPDKTNDGLPDILVAGINSARVISGKTGLTHSEFSLPVTGAGVAEIGDVNGDGDSDAAAATKTQVIVYSHVCGAIESYGAGCAGFGGATPVLTVQGCAIALTDLQFSITNAIGPSAALLLVGTTRASVPISGTCSLLVGGLLPGGIQLPLTGTGLAGSGHVEFGVDVPVAAVGMTATLQAFIFDPTTASGYSATQGVEVRFN